MERATEPIKLLVLGSKCSGTTAIYNLLQQILDDHFQGEVDYVFEPFQWNRTRFNRPCDELDSNCFADLSSLSIEGIYHHKNMPLFCRSTDSIPNETLTWIKDTFNTSHPSSLLAKMTRADGRTDALRQLIPDLKIIAVFQNPLEVINYSVEHSSSVADELFEDDYDRLVEETNEQNRSNNPVERQLQCWSTMTRWLSERANQSEMILPMVFEDFITAPESATQKLCNFIGVDSCDDYTNRAIEITQSENVLANNLTAQQYLFLENRLADYKQLLSDLSDLNLDEALTSIRKRFITESFREEPPELPRSMAGSAEADSTQIRDLLGEVAELKSKLDEKEVELSEQLTGQNRLLETLKNDLHFQTNKLSQFDSLLNELHKVQSYPATQIDRKYRAYRNLIKTYDAVKPVWHGSKHPGYSKSFLKRLKQTARHQGINLGNQLDVSFGNHRSGWAYAVESLEELNNSNGIYLDTFIERTFCWSPDGVRPHRQPWIGFIHMPPFAPAWFNYEQSNNCIFETTAWKESQPYCRGLFTLSKYHRDHLQPKFDFPVENLIHPTEFPVQYWSWYEFEANPHKRIIQLGWWLRKLHAIYQLPKTSYQKTVIKPVDDRYLNNILEKEKTRLTVTGEFDDSMYPSVESLSFLSNQEYDQLLSCSVAFLYLYDASANNSVIECIVRGTPLLVNRIPAVVEYLGEDYPLYYDSLHEAAGKAMDFKLIKETHDYLMQCETRKKLTGEYFKQSLIESNVLLNAYQSSLEPKGSAA